MTDTTDTGTPPAATDGTVIAPAPPPTADELVAERDKWKELARKNEQRAKENASAATELEKLRQSAMSDTEKAVVEAKKAGAAEAQSTFAQRIAAAEIRAALAGIVDDPQNVVDDLNLAKFVTDDGEVDAQAVQALRERWVSLVGQRKAPDFGQGQRGTTAPPPGDPLREMYARATGRTS